MQKRKDEFLRNYKNFRRQAKEYLKANKLEENMFNLQINFEIDGFQYEIDLSLNLTKSLPIKENVHFQFASNSKLFKHILTIVRMQNEFTRADTQIKDNQKEYEGLVDIRNHYIGKQPLILNASLQKINTNSSMLMPLKPFLIDSLVQKPSQNQTIHQSPHKRDALQLHCYEQISTDEQSCNASRVPADTACLDDIKEGGDESIRIDPRLLEEIVETSQECCLSSIKSFSNEQNHDYQVQSYKVDESDVLNANTISQCLQVHQVSSNDKSQVIKFMNQFMDQQQNLLRAIKLISLEVNSLSDSFQLKVLYQLRDAFQEMKTAVTYLRSLYAFQEMFRHL